MLESNAKLDYHLLPLTSSSLALHGLCTTYLGIGRYDMHLQLLTQAVWEYQSEVFTFLRLQQKPVVP